MNLNWLQALVLGITQGIGEFLPISSSGHLTIVQNAMGIEDTGMLLEVLLHGGTLLVVACVYFKVFLNMLKHPVRSLLPELIVASIPAALAEFLIGDILESAFGGSFLGWSFLITSAFLLTADLISQKSVPHTGITWRDTIVMGIMQAVALLPGVSRFGSTLAGGTASGLKQKKAADFSFIMSAPVVFGSLLLQLKDLFIDGEGVALSEVNWGTTLFALAVTAVVGFATIRLSLSLLRKVKLRWFSLYTACVGIFVLLDQAVFHLIF